MPQSQHWEVISARQKYDDFSPTFSFFAFSRSEKECPFRVSLRKALRVFRRSQLFSFGFHWRKGRMTSAAARHRRSGLWTGWKLSVWRGKRNLKNDEKFSQNGGFTRMTGWIRKIHFGSARTVSQRHRTDVPLPSLSSSKTLSDQECLHFEGDPASFTWACRSTLANKVGSLAMYSVVLSNVERCLMLWMTPEK